MAASPRIGFRAVAPLDQLIERRRGYPDVAANPLIGEPGEPYEFANPGTVAARDLNVYYRLLDAELADAQLTSDQAMMIVDAVWSLFLDSQWVTAAPTLLAAEVEDAYGDDEDGPDETRKALAATIAAWPRLRALAVVEAAVATRTRLPHSEDPDEVLTAVGLLRPARRPR